MGLYFLAKGDLLPISSFFEREHNVVSRLHENEHCGPLTTSVWWLMLCVNLTELRDAPRDGKTWLLGLFARVCLEEISIWISERSQEDDPPQCWWASSNSLRAWWKKKVKEGWIRSLLKPRHPSLLLPLDVGAPCSWAFRFRLGLTPLAPLVLRPLGLDWSYITRFPEPQAFRQQVVGLLGLHNCLSQSLIVNLFLYIYIYIGSISLEKPNTAYYEWGGT